MELAVCIPILVPIVFAAIEAAGMIFAQQALQTTAYETARIAVKPGSTDAEAIKWGEQVIQLRKVQGTSISISPSVDGLAPGIDVTVTVTADIAANRLLPTWFFDADDLSASCTMQRE
jgi:Flp pilus assembly protein TadG